MNITPGTLKFTSDSLANSSIEWGATDLAWFSPSSDLGDRVGSTGVDPTPPPPITGSQLFDWVGGAGVDPTPPTTTGSQLPDWVGAAGINANNAFSSSGMLNAWHEAANVTLVQAVSGATIHI